MGSRPGWSPSIEWKMGPLVEGIRADSKWPFERAESGSNGTKKEKKTPFSIQYTHHHHEHIQ
jgi:hypothetical protein